MPEQTQTPRRCEACGQQDPIGERRRPGGAPVAFSITHPETGAVLLEVRTGEAGPTLVLFDAEGVPAVELCASRKQGAYVGVMNAYGQPVAEMLDYAGEGGGVAVLNPTEHGLAGFAGQLNANPDGKGPQLELTDAEGAVVLHLPPKMPTPDDFVGLFEQLADADQELFRAVCKRITEKGRAA